MEAGEAKKSVTAGLSQNFLKAETYSNLTNKPHNKIIKSCVYLLKRCEFALFKF